MTKGASAEVLPFLLADMLPGLWDAEDAQDIFINREGEIWCRIGGAVRHVTSPKLTASRVRSIATHAAQLRGQRFDAAMPLLDAELPGGERLAAVLHPCTPGDCPLLAIRRGSADMPTLDELEAQGVFGLYADRLYKPGGAQNAAMERLRTLRDGGEIAAMLRQAMAHNLTVAFVGSTGSGKTHDMKALWSAMDPDRRTLFVGDTNEVPKVIPLRNYGIMLAGKHGDIPQAKLIAQTLRMAPELLCVLETRDGDAAWALYRALASGHQGMTSWHSGSARDAFGSLAAMMHESPSARGMTVQDIVARLRVLFHIIVSVARMPDGTFRVTEALLGDEINA